VSQTLFWKSIPDQCVNEEKEDGIFLELDSNFPLGICSAFFFGQGILYRNWNRIYFETAWLYMNPNKMRFSDSFKNKRKFI
jgi:hypothetical protein